MKTFTEVYNELRNHNRNTSTIQLLKAAGENAIVLDKGECVANFVNGVLTQVTPVPVDAPGVVIGIDLAKGNDFSTFGTISDDGRSVTILDNNHEPVIIDIDTSTEEGKEAVEELQEIISEIKSEYKDEE